MDNILKGSEFLLEVEDPGAPGNFSTLGGLKSKTLTLNGEPVDVTNHGSAGYRKLLNGTGINSIDVAGDGVTVKIDSLKDILEFWVNRAQLTFRVSIKLGADNVVQITGPFAIASIEFSGENDKEVPYSISLQSADKPDIQIY